VKDIGPVIKGLSLASFFKPDAYSSFVNGDIIITPTERAMAFASPLLRTAQSLSGQAIYVVLLA